MVPFGLDLLLWAEKHAFRATQTNRGIREAIPCAPTMGFFFWLRVGEIESLRMKDVRLDVDEEYEAIITIHLRPSTTDRYK